LISFPLVLLPLLLGGARPWFWSLVAGIFFAGMIILVLAGWHSVSLKDIPNKSIVLFLLLLGYPFIQALPLPLSWLDIISPHRMIWYQTANEAVHLPGWVARTIAYIPLTTIFSAMWWIFLVVYALPFRTLAHEEQDLKWFFRVLFIIAGFEAFYGLLQVLIPSLGVLWESGGQGVARGTFVNRNHYAAFLGMIWPILLAYLLSMRKTTDRYAASSYSEKERLQQIRHKQLFLAFVTGLILLALFFSQSRGGIIGAMVALTVFVAFKLTRRGWMLLFVAGCWLVMSVYGAIIGFEGILARFDHLSEGDPSRFLIWKDTWRLIMDHPWTGVGLGDYASVFRIYQSHLPDTLRASHAHNDYLQLAAELGLPMAIGLSALVWGYWWRTVGRLQGWKAAKQSSGDAGWSLSQGQRLRRGREARGKEHEAGAEQRRLIAVGALAGSAAFLCHSWMEFNWQIPANQLYFVVLLVLMRI
jgi:O-antigen ligase